MDKDRKLIAAIEEQESLSVGRGDLSEDRQEALDRFFGRPYGDEEEGRSQVVMRDVADTINWIKPDLLEIFTAGEEVCVFNPVGPEDEPQAEQETDYINHVLMQKNNGFLVFHDWFHDALLQRNGYVLARPYKEDKTQEDRYENLTDDEFALIAQNPEVEVLEHEARTEEFIDPNTGELQSLKYHSVVIACKYEKRGIKVQCIPPERVAVASDWPNVGLAECPFVRVEDYLTISDLRVMGYDVDDEINDTSQDDSEWQSARRDVAQDGYDDDRDDIEADPSTRRVKTRFVWIRYDYDGDGIAELRRMVVVGRTILENEKDALIPVACLSPDRMPHEHVGQSIDDAVKDLQRIRTTLVRGFLDNMYLQNAPRTAVDSERVNLADLMTARPGGIIRVKGGPDGAFLPVIHPANGPAILQGIEYIDSVRENRTGVTRYNQGMDADSLNKTATGVNAIMGAAQQRKRLIARVFAETGVKDLMLIIHALSMKNSRQQELVKLRGQWIPVSPSSWKERTDMTVNVGIGTGNKDQEIQQLIMQWQMQMAALPMGIATPVNLYETATRISHKAGFKQKELFWTDPRQNPPPPPPPDPNMLKVQAEVQGKQAELQMKQQESQSEMAFKERMAQLEERMKMIDIAMKERELEFKERELGLKVREAEVTSALRVQGAQDERQFRLQKAEDDRNIAMQRAETADELARAKPEKE